MQWTPYNVLEAVQSTSRFVICYLSRQNTFHKMNNSTHKGDEVEDVIYGISAVYLVIVAIAGGVFNIVAFVKATKVSCQYKK